ncbi:MAG: thioredoxin domain-containing protein, partial [Cyanobacteria bacterium J06576_12]
MTSDPANNPSKNSKWWIAALGLVGATTVGAALFLSAQAPSPNEDTAASPTEEDATENAEGPSDPASQAEAEAAERAEWEAQMQRVNDIVQSMDREALIGGSQTRGPKDAPVVLIKFSDFQCPYCALASANMK